MSLKVAPQQPVFKMHMHMSMTKGGLMIYRDEALGVQCDIFTPKKKGEWGHPERIFSIDGDKRQFKTGQELMAALAERNPKPV